MLIIIIIIRAIAFLFKLNFYFSMYNKSQKLQFNNSLLHIHYSTTVNSLLHNSIIMCSHSNVFEFGAILLGGDRRKRLRQNNFKDMLRCSSFNDEPRITRPTVWLKIVLGSGRSLVEIGVKAKMQR